MMKHLRLALSLSLILFTFLGSIPKINAAPTSKSSVSESDADEDDTQNGDSVKNGLQFRLSEGAGQPERKGDVNVAPAARLSEGEIQNVLKRLPPVKAESGDDQEFAMRDRSLPPPRTGKTINVSFPSSEPQPTPEQKTAGPLEVLRFAPEGDVPIAPQLSITFSQPMVDVTSNDDLAAQDVPVKLTPQPPGKWRWVGTKTLPFVPDGRFPMATTYSASVVAGTKSGTGGNLSATKTWSFATPPPTVKVSYPYSSTPVTRDSLMFVEFDQRIDPAAVLNTIKVQSGNSQLKICLATQEEVDKDQTVSQLAKSAEKGRWLAFRAVNSETNDTRLALPADAGISVQLGPGTPSAEGPRTTTSAQSFSFRTYGLFRVTDHKCGYDYSGANKCTPFDAWMITFSNPIDAAAFDVSQLRVEPEMQSIKTQTYGNVLYITGRKRGRTTYKVTLNSSIKDTFNQALGKDVSVTFNVGAAPPSLVSNGKAFVALDPSGPRAFSVYSVNHSTLKVSLYRVAPEDWAKFTHYMRFVYDYYEDPKQKQMTPPGRLVSSKTVQVALKPDEMVETRVDLTPALDDGLGQVIVIVEGGAGAKKRDRQSVEAWVQATNIGLSAFVDNNMYRPGEEVHIKGWIRKIGGGKTGDVGLPGAADVGRTVSYTLRDSQGNEVTKGNVQINALGGFDLKLKLPGTMNLGNGYVELKAVDAKISGDTTQHYFQVQEFRRPEFEVTAQATSEGPFFVKGSANAAVTAAYYAGGGLPNADVNWRVTSTPTNFTPPNRSDFTFGEWIPWWRPASGQNESHTETFTGHTDAAGKHRLKIDFDSVNPPRASNLNLQASVTDVNRQQWTATTNMLVHPADLYVGLKSDRTFVQQNEPLVV